MKAYLREYLSLSLFFQVLISQSKLKGSNEQQTMHS